MSKLLLDEKPLQVLPALATAIGLNEAIAIQQLHWLMQQENFGEDHDGRHWVRMTLVEWRKRHFPFWSEPTIQRVFDSLQKLGLVLSSDDFNKLSFDRTNWYSIDYEAVEKAEAAFQKDARIVEHIKLKNGARKMKNASYQSETTIPESSSSESSSENKNKNGVQANPEAGSPGDAPIEEIPVEETRRDSVSMPLSDYDRAWNELRDALVIVSPVMMEKFGELWREHPDLRRHEFALNAMKENANPVSFRYYETCFLRYDPDKEKPPKNHQNGNGTSNGQHGQKKKEYRFRSD